MALTDQQLRDAFARQYPRLVDLIDGVPRVLDDAAYQARLDQWVANVKAERRAKLQTLAAEVRRRLELSDWTMLPDSGLDRTAWAGYRTALRQLIPNLLDGTADPDDPLAWPEPPAATPLRPVR